MSEAKAKKSKKIKQVPLFQLGKVVDISDARNYYAMKNDPQLAEWVEYTRILAWLGRFPVFLPRERIPLGSHSLIFTRDEIGCSFGDMAIYGTTLNTDDETVLLVLNSLLLKKKTFVIRTSLYQIAMLGWGYRNKSLYRRIRESLKALNVAKFIFTTNQDKELHISFIYKMEFENPRDAKGTIKIEFTDIYYYSMFNVGENYFVNQYLKARRELKAPNLLRLYSFLVSVNFRKISLQKVYNNAKVTSNFYDFKKRLIKNYKLIYFLEKTKRCKVNITKDMIEFISIDIDKEPQREILPENLGIPEELMQNKDKNKKSTTPP